MESNDGSLWIVKAWASNRVAVFSVLVNKFRYSTLHLSAAPSDWDERKSGLSTSARTLQTY